MEETRILDPSDRMWPDWSASTSTCICDGQELKEEAREFTQVQKKTSQMSNIHVIMFIKKH